MIVPVSVVSDKSVVDSDYQADISLNLFLKEMYRDQVGEFVCGYCLKELNIP